MEKLTGSQKKYLRGLAHHLQPVMMIGKHGLTDTVIKGIDKAIADHELIKVKFVEFKKEKKEISALIEERANCEMAGLIGNIATFYRPHKDIQKRKIDLPGS